MCHCLSPSQPPPLPPSHPHLLLYLASCLVAQLHPTRCVVQRVDEDTERVVVTLNRTMVPPSSALYLRSLLSETFAANAFAAQAGTKANAAPVRPWGRLEFGATTNAVVVALKEYGVVLKPVASTGKGKKGAAAGADKGGQLMVCPLEHAMDGVEEGNEVKVSHQPPSCFGLTCALAFAEVEVTLLAVLVYLEYLVVCFVLLLCHVPIVTKAMWAKLAWVGNGAFVHA